MPQFLSGNIASRTVSATQLIHNSFVKRIARELILTANLLTSCFFCLVLGIPVGLSLGVRVMPPTKSINAPNILFMSGDLYVGRLVCRATSERTSNFDVAGQQPLSEVQSVYAPQ